VSISVPLFFGKLMDLAADMKTKSKEIAENAESLDDRLLGGLPSFEWKGDYNLAEVRAVMDYCRVTVGMHGAGRHLHGGRARQLGPRLPHDDEQ